MLAEGEVYMKLPLTNVASSATSAAQADLATNRFLEVHSEKFLFEEATSNRLARAIYHIHVRVVHPEASISAVPWTSTRRPS